MALSGIGPTGSNRPQHALIGGWKTKQLFFLQPLGIVLDIVIGLAITINDNSYGMQKVFGLLGCERS